MITQPKDWFCCTTLPSVRQQAKALFKDDVGNLKALRAVYRRVAERVPQMSDAELVELRADLEETTLARNTRPSPRPRSTMR